MSVESLITFFSGNDVLLKFTVADEDNPPAAKNLTGATAIIFVIATAQGVAATVTKSLGSGITLTDATNGKFEVILTKADTESLDTTHRWHEARVTDAAGNTVTVAFGIADIKVNSITT